MSGLAWLKGQREYISKIMEEFVMAAPSLRSCVRGRVITTAELEFHSHISPRALTHVTHTALSLHDN